MRVQILLLLTQGPLLAAQPSETPTDEPTEHPSHQPTEHPSHQPSQHPTRTPTEEPSAEPTRTPTEKPTATPTELPSLTPTEAPTPSPTVRPTELPTRTPTWPLTQLPTPAPTAVPAAAPCYLTNTNGTLSLRPAEVYILLDGSGSMVCSHPSCKYSMENWDLEKEAAIAIVQSMARNLTNLTVGMAQFSAASDWYGHTDGASEQAPVSSNLAQVVNNIKAQTLR